MGIVSIYPSKKDPAVIRIKYHYKGKAIIDSVYWTNARKTHIIQAGTKAWATQKPLIAIMYIDGLENKKQHNLLDALDLSYLNIQPQSSREHPTADTRYIEEAFRKTHELAKIVARDIADNLDYEVNDRIHN